MVYRLALLSFLSTGLIAALALAESEPAAKASPAGKKFSEVSWTKAGTYQWDRPENVRYVLVRACGGGGGGGGSYSLFPKPAPKEDGGTAAGGGGGAGSPVATILLGPLTAA